MKIEIVTRAKGRHVESIDAPSPLHYPYSRPEINDFFLHSYILHSYERWLDERLKDPDSAQSRELRRLATIALLHGELFLYTTRSPVHCPGRIIQNKLRELLS